MLIKAETILLFASLIGAITAIITAVIKLRNWLKTNLTLELAEDITDIKSLIEQARLRSIRCELLLMINNQPEKVDAIENTYDEYAKAGGNSYVSDVINVWREEYAKKAIKKRIVKPKED